METADDLDPVLDSALAQGKIAPRDREHLRRTALAFGGEGSEGRIWLEGFLGALPEPVRAEAESPEPAPSKRSIYHKEIPISADDAERGHAVIDVYRVLVAFGVTDPCIQHAIKKLLCPGQRKGGKTVAQDVHEALWSLQRWEEMRAEEATK